MADSLVEGDLRCDNFAKYRGMLCSVCCKNASNIKDLCRQCNIAKENKTEIITRSKTRRDILETGDKSEQMKLAAIEDCMNCVSVKKRNEISTKDY